MSEQPPAAGETGALLVNQVILAPSGKPFSTVKDAEIHLRKQNLNPREYGTLPYEGGFGITTFEEILRRRDEADRQREAARERNRIPAPMKFYRVQIHPGIGDNDSKTVLLSVANDAIVVNRGETVILDEPHMEVLRNAKMEDMQPVDKQTQALNPERAIAASHAMAFRFPFTMLGEATAKEFEEFMALMRKSTIEYQERTQLKAKGATA